MAEAYERIADALRRRVHTGRLRPGDRLPAENRLAEEYGGSVPAVRHALGVLRDEGLIEQEHGRGAFVRLPRTRAVRSNLRHQWEKDRARAPREQRARTGATERDTGLETDDLVFHASYRETKADRDLAEAFGVDEGTALVERSYRTRYAAETTPLTLVTSYLVRDVIASNPDLLDETNEPWPGGTQSQLHTVGIELDRFEEHVTARPPSPEEAAELGLPPGMPVLILRKFAYDTEDRVVEVSDIKLPGDRMEMVFTTRLERW